MSAVVSFILVEGDPPVRTGENVAEDIRVTLAPWLRWYLASQTDDAGAIEGLLEEILRRMQFGHFARGADDVRWAFGIADRVLMACHARNRPR